MTLPEGDLTTDHITHHTTLHDLLNLLGPDITAAGRVLMVESLGTPNAVGGRSPMELMTGHLLTVTHSVAGALTIPLARETRAVVVTASANITSGVITNGSLAGDWFELPVLLKATASITVDLTGITTVGPAVPGSMVNTDAVPFRAMVWP